MAHGTGIAAGLAGLVAAAARGQECQPHWTGRFMGNGPDSGVQALAALSDDHGAALYVGGRFPNVGALPSSRVARWDGAAWSGLGSGIPAEFNCHGIFGCCSAVYSFCGAFSGDAAVHIGGDFIVADGTLVESIARWIDDSWSPMAGGVAVTGCTDCAFRVLAQTIYDDGQGPALYAAGTFDHAGAPRPLGSRVGTGSRGRRWVTGSGASRRRRPRTGPRRWPSSMTARVRSCT